MSQMPPSLIPFARTPAEVHSDLPCGGCERWRVLGHRYGRQWRFADAEAVTSLFQTSLRYHDLQTGRVFPSILVSAGG
jgi:hypothetical protein